MEIKQKGIVLCKNRCILIGAEGVKQKHLLRIPQIYKNSYFSAKANLNLPSFFERRKNDNYSLQISFLYYNNSIN